MKCLKIALGIVALSLALLSLAPVGVEAKEKESRFPASQTEVKGETLEDLAESYLKQVKSADSDREAEAEKAGDDAAEVAEANERFEARVIEIRHNYQEALSKLLKKLAGDDEGIEIALNLFSVCVENDDPSAAKDACDLVLKKQRRMASEDKSKLLNAYADCAMRCTDAEMMKDAVIAAADLLPITSVREQAMKLRYLREGVQALGLVRAYDEIDDLCDEMLKLPVAKDNDATKQSINDMKSQFGGEIKHFKRTSFKSTVIDTKDYKGKLVLLEFWMVHCPFCKKELPHLQDLYTKYNDLGFEIIGIIGGEDANTITNYISEKNIEWPVVEDYLIDNTWLGNEYSVAEVPYFFLVDPDGKLMAASMGKGKMGVTMDHEKIGRALKAYFKENPDGTPAIVEAAKKAAEEESEEK